MKKNLHTKKPRKTVKRVVKPATTHKKSARWENLMKVNKDMHSIIDNALDTRFFINNKPLIEKFTDEERKNFLGYLKGIADASDVKRKQLDEIFKLHVYKTAKHNTVDQMFDMMDVSSQYNVWLEDWKNTVVEIHLHPLFELVDKTTYLLENDNV